MLRFDKIWLTGAGVTAVFAHICLTSPYGDMTDLGLLAAAFTGLFMGLSLERKS